MEGLTQCLCSILETHSKTVIIIGGALLSVFVWFLFLIVISRIYEQAIGIYIVRDAFLENFGRRLVWWTIGLLEVGALVVMDLVIQAIRRVYWPTDEDLMQRVEKDEAARKALFDRAAAMEKGETEGVELQDLVPRMDERKKGDSGGRMSRAVRHMKRHGGKER